MRTISIIFLFSILFVACESDSEGFTPKPRGFPRIELPEAAYQPLETKYPFARYFADGIPDKSLLSSLVSKLPTNYPFSFEYSRHAVLKPDTSFQREPYWLEILYPELNASIHVTIKFVGNQVERFEDYVNDSHTLVTKHGARLQGIQDVTVETQEGYGVKFYELEGDVPTSFQYAVTDTNYNYFRAALYVPYANKNDSLQPILDYVRQDMLHLLETFRFEDIGQYKTIE